MRERYGVNGVEYGCVCGRDTGAEYGGEWGRCCDYPRYRMDFEVFFSVAVNWNIRLISDVRSCF